ncbi:hypothetical protein KAR91_56960 [Candidatus Pacearchaeota archaeon]|nr:hypothetical protein [Candidatus Pacearchaeota archaeon]
MNNFEIRIAQVLGHGIQTSDISALSNMKLKLKDGRAKGKEQVFNKAIDLLEAKIEAAKEAVANYRQTGLALETGRSHHTLEVRPEGVWGTGGTCCDTGGFGCTYLGTCKVRPPQSGWVAKIA